jgi:hypothetical protein
MARQRFIWPSLWEDPDLGRVDPLAELLYIGCFSNADDEGRLIGDPTYLKTQMFRYRSISPARVRKLRDELAAVCSNFHVYTVHDVDYIQFLNWPTFQKPKYPTPSKLPSPEAIPGISPEHSSEQRSEQSPETIPQRVGLGGVGLDPLPHEVGNLNPRAKGTNPRANAKRDKQRRRTELLAAAERFAHDWNDGTSEAFDEGLDELEHLYATRLDSGDRYRLWDKALTHG